MMYLIIAYYEAHVVIDAKYWSRQVVWSGVEDKAIMHVFDPAANRLPKSMIWERLILQRI